MDDSPARQLQLASDEVLRLIGRNLLLYQRIEKNLKRLDGSGRPITIDAATNDESLIEQVRTNHAVVERYTLGTVVRRLIKIGDSPNDQRTDGQLENCLTLSTGIAFEDTPETHAWANDFRTMIEARNRLAHGFLDHFNLETLEGCEEARRQLDREYEAARSYLHFTRSAREYRIQAFQTFTAFLQSDDFAEAYAQMSVLIEFTDALAAEVTRLARPDGWCAFARAVQALRASQPELITTLQSVEGSGSLRAAAEATRAFEWREEPAKRGVRLLLRWHPG